MGTSRPNWGRSPSWTRFRVICKALLGKQARRRTIGWWAESDDWSAAHGWLARGNDPWGHVQRDAGAHSGGRHRRPDRRRLVPDDAPTLTRRRLVRWLRRADPRANANGTRTSAPADEANRGSHRHDRPGDHDRRRIRHGAERHHRDTDDSADRGRYSEHTNVPRKDCGPTEWRAGAAPTRPGTSQGRADLTMPSVGLPLASTHGVLNLP